MTTLAEAREHFGVREWSGQRVPLAVRILRRVVEQGDCWVWTGSMNLRPVGYGETCFRGRKVYTHRAAYELFVGPIPQGLSLDHLCRNPPCCNPAHLEPVSQRENVLRGTSPAAEHAASTHCKYGHEFTPANTYTTTGGARRCRVCRADYFRTWAARRATAASA